MTYLHKHRAGSTSLGYTWDEDGQAVEVADEHVVLLLAIPDGGFRLAELVDLNTQPDPDVNPSGSAPATPDSPEQALPTDPGPESESAPSASVPAPVRRGRKTPRTTPE